jgi:HSP20 family protein
MSTELTQKKPETMARTNGEPRYVRPDFDVFRADDNFIAEVYLPGVTKENVNVSVEEDVLEVTGHREQQVPEGWRPVRRELPQADFRLRLTLHRDIDREKIHAELKDGVLRLTLPRAESVKPRQIQIA